MNIYVTTIKAINPLNGQIESYFGPRIKAISFSDAQDYCNRNGLGYCKVEGLLLGEIGLMDDWDKIVDYNTNRLN